VLCGRVNPEPATPDSGTSSTDHGHAVSAREYKTDSSSKRPAPLTSSKQLARRLTGHSISALASTPAHSRVLWGTRRRRVTSDVLGGCALTGCGQIS
jgi:hypothetical protein